MQEIKEAYEKVQNLRGLEAEKWFHQLLWGIAVHFASEELIVYDALDKIGIAKNLVDKSRFDHQHVKQAISKIDGLPLTSEVRVLFVITSQHFFFLIAI